MKKKYSLQKMLLLLLITLILPLNIISIIISSIIINDAMTSIKNSIEVTLESYTGSIGQVIYNTNYQLYDLLNNNTAGTTFSSRSASLDYELAKNSLSRILLNSQQLIQQADVFYFCRTDLEDLLIIPHNTTIYDRYLNEHDYTKITAENGVWHLAQLEEGTYLTRQQLDSNVAYGAFINLDTRIQNLPEDIQYPVTDITFSSEPVSESAGQIVISSKCSNASVYLNVILNQSVFNRNISILRWILILLSAFYVILIPLLYRFLRRWIVCPLEELNTAHAKLQNGMEDYRITASANSIEFIQAYTSFNNMAISLQSLKLEKISNELVRKQMLLDNLQLQIRPHFLLNTFNLIYSMLQAQKTAPAQEILLYISEYFRYLFKYDQNLVLFPKEWELIEQYMTISKYQYADAFTFQYSLDPEISLVRIPPLLLHNFMENILKHALTGRKVVHIMVSGFYENGIVTFQIADDGCGMSQEEVTLINSGNFEDYARGQHVGIRNSMKRLKYFYNNQGTVSVESTIGEGTLFTITFPFDLEASPDIEMT